MATTDPTNVQLKAMFRIIKFSTNAAMELVTGQGINYTKEIKTITQDCLTHLCLIIRYPGEGTNGHVVSDSAENIFHFLVFYFQH